MLPQMDRELMHHVFREKIINWAFRSMLCCTGSLLAALSLPPAERRNEANGSSSDPAAHISYSPVSAANDDSCHHHWSLIAFSAATAAALP
jgi:hypothetical protein